jgi:hypothetical protein
MACVLAVIISTLAVSNAQDFQSLSDVTKNEKILEAM